MMQLCPAGQSVEVWQASWHLPAVHTSGELQSLLRMQVPPTSIFFGPLQPTMRNDETMIDPRMRCPDADISILQFCFCRREGRAGKGITGAVNRFYQLLRNGHVDYLEFVAQWIDILARRHSHFDMQ
jgi:hypothetical protein